MISGGLAGGYHGSNLEESFPAIAYDQALLFVGLIGGEGVIGAGLTGLVMSIGPFAQIAMTFLVSYNYLIQSDLSDEEFARYKGLLIGATTVFLIGLAVTLGTPALDPFLWKAVSQTVLDYRVTPTALLPGKWRLHHA